MKFDNSATSKDNALIFYMYIIVCYDLCFVSSVWCWPHDRYCTNIKYSIIVYNIYIFILFNEICFYYVTESMYSIHTLPTISSEWLLSKASSSIQSVLLILREDYCHYQSMLIPCSVQCICRAELTLSCANQFSVSLYFLIKWHIDIRC